MLFMKCLAITEGWAKLARNLKIEGGATTNLRLLFGEEAGMEDSA